MPPSPRPQLQGTQRKLQEQEGEFRIRERGLLSSLEEARTAEKQQLEHARSLELKLEAARAEAAELGLRLSAAEGRAQGLEAELARMEAQRRAAEAQLGALRSALRRGLGLGRGPSPAARPMPVPCSPAREAPAGGEHRGQVGLGSGERRPCALASLRPLNPSKEWSSSRPRPVLLSAPVWPAAFSGWEQVLSSACFVESLGPVLCLPQYPIPALDTARVTRDTE